MLATLASAAAAPPLAPPGAADAPTLDLYVGEERRTTITTNFGTATDRLLRARGVELSLRRRGPLVRRAALATGRLFQVLYSSLAVVVDRVDRRRDE